MKSKTVEDKKRDREESKLRRQELVDSLMQNRLYSYEEVAEMLGLSTRTLERAVSAGELKTVRIGKQRRFSAETIRDLVYGAESLLTVQEAAALAGVSDQVIRGLIKLNKIKAFRLARKRGPFKIPRTEIERLIKEGASYDRYEKDDNAK